MDYELIGKIISEKNRLKKQKKNKNLCQNAAIEDKKPLARNVNLIVEKNTLRMNYECTGKKIRSRKSKKKQ